jgi:hypothetical protein
VRLPGPGPLPFRRDDRLGARARPVATSANEGLRASYEFEKLGPEQRGRDEMQAPSRNAAVTGRLIGYARVSTVEQGTDPPQSDELREAGCVAIHENTSPGANHKPPRPGVVAERDLTGETLVVVRLCFSAACAIESTPRRRKDVLAAGLTQWASSRGAY